MYYNYRKGIAYGKSCGVALKERRFENFDQMAKAHGYSQAQIDIAVQNFVHVVSPQSYGFWERVKIGFDFIRGKI